MFASISNSNYIQVFNSDGSKKLQIAHTPRYLRIGTGDGQLNRHLGLAILGEVCMWLIVVTIVCKSSLSQESILVSLATKVYTIIGLVIHMVSALMVGGVS